MRMSSGPSPRKLKPRSGRSSWGELTPRSNRAPLAAVVAEVVEHRGQAVEAGVAQRDPIAEAAQPGPGRRHGRRGPGRGRRHAGAGGRRAAPRRGRRRRRVASTTTPGGTGANSSTTTSRITGAWANGRPPAPSRAAPLTSGPRPAGARRDVSPGRARCQPSGVGAVHRVGRKPAGGRDCTGDVGGGDGVGGGPGGTRAAGGQEGAGHSFRSLAAWRSASSAPPGMVSWRRSQRSRAQTPRRWRAPTTMTGPANPGELAQRLGDRDAALAVGLDGEGRRLEGVAGLGRDDAEVDTVVVLVEDRLEAVFGPQPDEAVERADVGAGGQPRPVDGRQDQPVLVVDRVLERPEEELGARARGQARRRRLRTPRRRLGRRPGCTTSLHFVGNYSTSPHYSRELPPTVGGRAPPSSPHGRWRSDVSSARSPAGPRTSGEVATPRLPSPGPPPVLRRPCPEAGRDRSAQGDHVQGRERGRGGEEIGDHQLDAAQVSDPPEAGLRRRRRCQGDGRSSRAWRPSRTQSRPKAKSSSMAFWTSTPS